MTANEQTRSTVKSHKPLETPHKHTFLSLPSTKATDQSQTFQLIAHTSTQTEVRNHGDNCFTINSLFLYIILILFLYQW